MNPIWLLLLLPLAAMGGWVMAKREPPGAAANNRAAKKFPQAYFEGLSFLLNEQPDKALQVFLEVVEMDQETVEIHLALGNLFRRRGEVERATRIHQNLVARANLDDRLRALALFELAQDYFKAGLFDRAENLFLELRQAAQHREQASRFLLHIYEQEKEWRRAIVVAEELARASGIDLSASLAQYCCELAEKAIASGQYEAAEGHLGAASKHDSHCVRAIIQSGRLAAMRGSHRNAIGIWRGLEHWAPEALGEVVDHLAHSYAALDDRANYRRFLEAAIEGNADSRILAALVEVVGQLEKDGAGQTLLLDWVRRRPSLEGLCELLKSRISSHRPRRENQDFAMLAGLLSQVAAQGRGYYCHTCGFDSNTLHWQCPGCKRWGTVQKRLALFHGKAAQAV